MGEMASMASPAAPELRERAMMPEPPASEGRMASEDQADRHDLGAGAAPEPIGGPHRVREQCGHGRAAAQSRPLVAA